MDVIYSKARNVRICIPRSSLPGYPTDYSRLMCWLRKGLPHANDETKQTLSMVPKQLFSVRYFSRVWVVQEVALARAAYLVVNNEELLLTPIVFERLSLLCSESHFELPGVLERSLVQEVRAEAITCLHTGWQCLATDPRDRVFAVLSLMPPEARSLIPVDYSLDLDSIYANAVVAVIATQQKLDILSYASLSAGLHAVSSLDTDAFRSYLNDSVGRHSPAPPGWRPRSSIALLPGFLGEQSGPWHAGIDVGILQSSNTWDLEKHRGKSCVIMRPPAMHVGLLPRLLVRAHYLDCVDQTNLEFHFLRKLVHGSCEPIPIVRHEYHPIAQFFHADVILDNPPVHNAHASQFLSMQDDADIVAADLAEFLRVYQDTRVLLPLFSSYHSVGCAVSHYWDSSLVKPGDEIFAIDGARTPFILRKSATGQYRVISACYLWAALELDCWNPGTKKGRWGDNVQRPTFEQTRMVEIY